MTFQRQPSNDNCQRKPRNLSNYCSKVARSHHPSPIVSHSISNRCQKPPGGIASSLSIASASSSNSRRASWSAASPASSNSRSCASLSAASTPAVISSVSTDSGTPRRQGGGWAFAIDEAGAPGRRALRERRVSALDDAWSPERQGGHLRRDAGGLRDGGFGVSDAGSGGRSGMAAAASAVTTGPRPTSTCVGLRLATKRGRIDAGGLREVVLSDSGGLREGCLGLSDTGSGGRCFAGIGAASRPRAGTTSTNPPADAATC